MATKITIADIAVNTSYLNLTGTTSGAGTGAKFNVTKTDGVYKVEAATSGLGSGYVAGDTITILGAAVGGVTGVNDIIVTVGTVGVGGAIASYGSIGTGRFGDGDTDVVVDIDGTDGVDTYTFVGDAADYDVVSADGDLSVTTSLVDNLVFNLKDHERVVFDDKAFAFDDAAADVYTILGAALGEDDITEEYVGAGLYLKELGWSNKLIAQQLLKTETYKLDAGGVSNETFVKHVWKNIFGTDATLAQVLEVTNIMDTYGYSQADILLVAANNKDFRETIGLVGIQEAGIEYIPYVE